MCIPELVFAGSSRWTFLLVMFVSHLMAANAGCHYGITIAQRELSPGVVTGVALYIPMSFYFSYVGITEFAFPAYMVWIVWVVAWIVHFRDFGTTFDESPNVFPKLLEKFNVARTKHPEWLDTQ